MPTWFNMAWRIVTLSQERIGPTRNRANTLKWSVPEGAPIPMSLDAFISYSSKDKPAADAACAVLESKGVRCWIAPRDILPGADYGKSIIDAINDCKLMVLIFSSHANQSQHVRREVERIVHRGLPLIPVRIEEVLPAEALEYFLSTPHWLDAYTPPLQRHLEHLATTVRQMLTQPTDKPTSSPARLATAQPGRASGRQWPRWLAPAVALTAAVVLGAIVASVGSRAGWFVQANPPASPTIPTVQAEIAVPTAPARSEVPRPAEGLEIRVVTPGSPAEKAGLRVGYVLVRIDGQPITSYASWVGALTQGPHKVTYWDDERRTLRETSVEKTNDPLGVSVSR
jgi:hypothetical protein